MDKKNFLEIFGTILLVILLYSYLPTISEIISETGSLDFVWQASKCTFEGINQCRKNALQTMNSGHLRW